MEHRHLDTLHWSTAAIDSLLERGDLRDWRELFRAVEQSAELAELVVKVASHHEVGGASILARALVERFRPGLQRLKTPAS